MAAFFTNLGRLGLGLAAAGSVINFALYNGRNQSHRFFLTDQLPVFLQSKVVIEP